MSADIEAIAREGLALSERATKGPWLCGWWSGQCHIDVTGHRHGEGACDYRLVWHEGGTDITRGALVEGEPYAQAIADGVMIAGQYDYDTGGILKEEDAALCAFSDTHLAALCRALLSRGQAQGWTEVTDDKATWPTDADTDVLVRQMVGEQRAYDVFSGGYARGWIEQGLGDPAKYRETRITHWMRVPRVGALRPAPATPEKR